MTTNKPELRRHFQALRDGSSPQDRARWSQDICRHVAALCDERGFRRIGVFAPFRSEVDLRALQESDPNLECFFPRVAGRDPARLAWGPPPLVPGTWGLLEPAETPFDQPPVQLLLVPGLAFAADGHRLGYGKGFYDGVLAALPPRVTTLGVGFELQRCNRLPAGPTDHPVQGLATEAGLTWFRPAR
ncbi:MAG: 5-formyltetrahydrofolate cyclo-ligase [Holophaga sp.]|jgi:5-formyltetrahydrofolate cyclo-ligase